MADVDCSSKKCSACGEVKAVSDFYGRKGSKDGLYGRCIACVKVSQRKYREENPEFHSARNKKYRLENLDKIRENKRKYFKENRDRVLEWNRKSQAKNAEKHNQRGRTYYAENRDRVLERCAEWKAENQDKRNEHSAARRAAKLKATPLWANKSVMRDIYRMARERRFHVDHIVPLVSEFVCGLHCESNLQILSPEENYRKNNRVWPDMP